LAGLSVAMVVPRFSPHIGGVETHVASIATRLLDAGVKVEVLTEETAPQVPRRAIASGIPVRRFRAVLPSENYPVAPGLGVFLARRRGGYDVVHAHNYHAVSSLMAALPAPAGFVFTPHYHGTGHSPLARVLHRPYRRLGAICFARARRVVCVSGAEADLVTRDFPAAASRTVVIPNGVDVHRIRAARAFSSELPVVLCAGRLEPHKRVGDVLTAFARLPRSCRLVILGDGSERRRLEELVPQLGPEGDVLFAGQVPEQELARWLKSARVCVSMSRSEAFGLTVSEGLAAGARAVVSDIPAHRELAQRMPPGAVTLVPLESGPERLAEALLWAAQADAPPQPFKVHSWDDVATATLKLYQEVVRRESPEQPDS
jgi:glycosyltransferase involved in cell wall biosynthesis